MEKRYRALRTIATIYKLLGVIAGAITLLIVLGLCAGIVLGGAALEGVARELGGGQGMGLLSSTIGGLAVGLFALLNGGLLALTFFSLGEGISLLIALEENTRYTAQVLNYQVRAGGEPPAPPAV